MKEFFHHQTALNRVGLFSYISDDILRVIFSYLSEKDMYSTIAQVCKHWQTLSREMQQISVTNNWRQPQAHAVVVDIPYSNYGSAIIHDIQLSNNNLIACGNDRSFKIFFNVATGAAKSDLKKSSTLSVDAHDSAVTCVRFNGKNIIVSGSEDRKIKIWNLNSHNKSVKLFHTFDSKDGHNCPVTTLEFDSQKIVSGASNGTIVFWDIQSGNKLINKLTEDCHTTRITKLQTANHILLSSSFDRTIRIWDLRSKNGPVGILHGHTAEVSSFQCELFKLVSASYDKTLKEWDLRNYSQDKSKDSSVNTLMGHLDKVTSVAFQNNNRLVSSSADGTVKVWQNWWNAKYDQPQNDSAATVATVMNYHKGCINAVQINSFLMIT
eukprot:CAMPEP_0168560342 /NCGR_PEP_ID=MMETSP0413-20121227/11008_1 /TAXON_ID=136452 /ORGANISM="Filamoeba nolandi, Strain NC-AS-23-1" /LENGTH=379 /DNA_ID=CAMNT_0008591635 /DNA_START=348 /DNA_END=1484 /DNA_ORIENTATION=-